MRSLLGRDRETTASEAHTMTASETLRHVGKQIDHDDNDYGLVLLVNALPEITDVIEAAERVREHDVPAVAHDYRAQNDLVRAMGEMYDALDALADFDREETP
jgi:hypothetical protein